MSYDDNLSRATAKLHGLDDEPNTMVLEHLDELTHRRGWLPSSMAYAVLVQAEQQRKTNELLHRIACALEAANRREDELHP